MAKLFANSGDPEQTQHSSWGSNYHFRVSRLVLKKIQDETHFERPSTFVAKRAVAAVKIQVKEHARYIVEFSITLVYGLNSQLFSSA